MIGFFKGLKPFGFGFTRKDTICVGETIKLLQPELISSLQKTLIEELGENFAEIKNNMEEDEYTLFISVAFSLGKNEMNKNKIVDGFMQLRDLGFIQFKDKKIMGTLHEKGKMFFNKYKQSLDSSISGWQG